jgi:hypothetical protein
MMRSHLLRIILATLALVVGVVQADAQSPTKVKIRLDWKGGAQHAPFYLGKEKGYYRDEGLDLDVISGSGSSDTIKQIGSKAVEFGLVDALVLVQGAQQRVPAKSIAAYYQTTPIVLISPQAKPVTNPRQLLDGIKLGSKKGSATFQGLVALLAANNMQLEQIKLVDIGFGVQPLLVKQVDAIMGFSMNEPIEAESGGMAVSLMPISDYGEYLWSDDRIEFGLHAAEARGGEGLHESDAAIRRRDRQGSRRRGGRGRGCGCRDRCQARGQGAGAHGAILAEQGHRGGRFRLADRAEVA